VRSVEIVRPKAGRGAASDAANATALESAATILGLEVRRGGQIIAPSLVSVGENRCTPLVEVSTPAPSGQRAKTVRRKFVIRAQGVFGRMDTDRFVTLCD
jgi:hypothetical protein